MVQNHFAGRKRPDKQGEMDKYAGFLYCGECGSRLYLHRAKTLDPKNNNFMCGGYQSRKSNCTSHYIRESVLDEIVLASLKKVTAYAREHSEEFYRIAAENGEREAEKMLKESESRKSEYASRMKQLDNIISTLYEDRVTGRITHERYDTLASGYEQEQSSMKSKLLELESQIGIVNLRENCIRDFVEKARQYIEMPVLTPELIKVFIKRIEVFEKEEKYSRTCRNRIIIYFTFQTDKEMKIDGTMLDSETKEVA
ncbi:MAG: recombinase zinc beta ribbon domain-containing protein [Ruminococcus flavefaciens]|nr:recombinase zinc beta ribbon domain-containing protein [Ruminococcus flavefaciens]MCM1062375.1 recombinase zinc beta ribbon domain-containing protein [Eubacterium sp.]